MDQWDWERVITAGDRNLDFLEDLVRRIWRALYSLGQLAPDMFPQIGAGGYDPIPEELVFIHAEEILEMYPDLPRKQRETRIITEHAPAVFILGVGYPLADGYPHEMRAADYGDWITDTTAVTGKDTHGLNETPWCGTR